MAYSLSFRCVKEKYTRTEDYLSIFGATLNSITNYLNKDTQVREEYHQRRRYKNIDIVIGEKNGKKYAFARWGSDICAVSEDQLFIDKIRRKLKGNYVTLDLVRLKPSAINTKSTVKQLLTELGVDEYKPAKAKENAEQLALI